MERTKKYFVSTGRHSKLQIIAFEKCLAFFPFYFRTTFFLKRAVGGNPHYFVRSSIPWPHEDGFSSPKKGKSPSGEQREVAPVLRFLAFGTKTHRISRWCVCGPWNPMNLCPESKHWCRFEGKMEIVKKSLVSTAGHSKLQNPCDCWVPRLVQQQPKISACVLWMFVS